MISSIARSNDHGTTKSRLDRGRVKPLKERLSAAAMEERLEEHQHRRGFEHQAEQIAVEEAELEEQSAQEAPEGPSRQQRRAEERRRTKLQARKLRLLERDDEAVIEILKRERRVDHILKGGQPTEADEMLWFLADELKLIKALEAVAPPETYFDEEKGKEIKRRQMWVCQLALATVFSTLALMFYRGLELHREQALEAFDRRAEQLGVLRYRRQRMLLNRGTVIIVIGDRYARVMMYDLMRLVGVEVLGAPPTS